MANTSTISFNQGEWGLFRLSNPAASPDSDRLPSFFCSDARYEKFVNSYFRRHLTAGPECVYWGNDLPMPGEVDSLWTLEADGWYLPWIDRNAIGILPEQMSRPHHSPGSSDTDIILTTLARVPIDKYGYVGECPLKFFRYTICLH